MDSCLQVRSHLLCGEIRAIDMALICVLNAKFTRILYSNRKDIVFHCSAVLFLFVDYIKCIQYGSVSLY